MNSLNVPHIVLNNQDTVTTGAVVREYLYYKNNPTIELLAFECFRSPALEMILRPDDVYVVSLGENKKLYQLLGLRKKNQHNKYSPTTFICVFGCGWDPMGMDSPIPVAGHLMDDIQRLLSKYED